MAVVKGLLLLTFTFVVQAIELLTHVPDAYIHKDDTVVYRMTQYFKADNKTLTFTSDSPGVKLEKAFTGGFLNESLDYACIHLRSGRVVSVDAVVGLCDDGKKLGFIVLNPITLKVEGKEFYDIPQGLWASDIRLANDSYTAYIAAKRTEEGLNVTGTTVLEFSLIDKNFSSRLDIPIVDNEDEFIEPMVTVDINSTEPYIAMWDRKPPGENISIRLAQRTKSSLNFVSYFGDSKGTLSNYLRYSKIRSLYIIGSKLYPIYKQDRLKQVTCETKTGSLSCSKMVELFYNIDDEFHLFIDIQPNQFIAVSYLSKNKLIRRSWWNSKGVGSADMSTLFLSSELDMKGKTYAYANQNDVTIMGTEAVTGKSILYHWTTDKEYVDVSRDFDLHIGAMIARRSLIDNEEFEIIYFDTLYKKLNMITVSGVELIIKGSDPAFSTPGDHEIKFKVSDGFNTRPFSFRVKVLSTVYGDYRLNTTSKFSLLPKVSGLIPLSMDALSANNPIIDITAKPDTAKVTFKYTKTVLASMEGADFNPHLMVKGINVGYNNFAFAYKGNLTMARCSKHSNDDIKCTKLFVISFTNERLIDAKFDKESFYIISSSINQTETSNSSLTFRALDLQGEELTSTTDFSINATDAIGAIRIFNHVVYAEVIAKMPNSSLWELFSVKFKDQAAIPLDLTHLAPFPSNICPKAIMWSPRKEPSILVESLCPNTEREILEYELDYNQDEKITITKTYILDTVGETEICATGNLIIIVDFAKKQIYGVDRKSTQDSRVAFPNPFDVDEIKSLSCSRYNHFFQVLVTRTEGVSKKNYLVTYKTNTVFQPNSRIHSAVPIDMSDAKLALQSINLYHQEVYTLIFGSTQSAIEAVYISLDVPQLHLDVKEVPDTVSEVEITMKIESPYGQSLNTSTFNVTIGHLQPYVALSSRVDDDVLYKFEDDNKTLNLENYYNFDGVPLDISITGLEAEMAKVSVLKRALLLPDNPKTSEYAYHGFRQKGDIMVAWNETHLTVFEKGVEVDTVPGVFVKSAEFVSENVTYPNGTVREVAYFMGHSKRRFSSDENIFVLFRQPSGRWKYASGQVPDGTAYIKVYLTSLSSQRFVYILSNIENDQIDAGLFFIKYDKGQEHYYLDIQKKAIIARLDVKLDHVSALYVNKMIRIIYNPRNTGRMYSLTIDPKDLKVYPQSQIELQAYPFESFEDSRIECSEAVYSKPTMIADDLNKASCAVSTKRQYSGSVVVEYPRDPQLPPKIISQNRHNNFPGFSVVSVRNACGYTAVLLKTRINDKSMTDLLPKTFENEAVVVQIWRNYENSTFAVIKGSELGYKSLPKEKLASTILEMDFNCWDNTTQLTFSTNAIGESLKSLELRPLSIIFNDKSADLKKLKLRVVGLNDQKDFAFTGSFTAKANPSKEGAKNLNLVMIAITSAVLVLIALALVYYFCTRVKSATNLNEPEVAFASDANVSLTDH